MLDATQKFYEQEEQVLTLQKEQAVLESCPEGMPGTALLKN